MRTSAPVLALAKRVPLLGKLGVWAAVRIGLATSRPSLAKHWLVDAIANALSYRVPIWTRLGNGLKIRVAWNDMIGRCICESSYYEPDTVRLIEQVLVEGDVIFDVGAHVGQYTLVASRRVGPRGQVHSFEPDSRTFAWLAENVRVNQLSNVTLNQSAVAADHEPKPLYFSTSSDIGSNSLALQRPHQQTGRSELVECTTLDAYRASHRLRSVDLIKADVEGAELWMLRGAKEILRSPRPPTLVLEFEEERQRAFGSSCAQLAEELQQHGYDLWKIGPPLERHRPRDDDPHSYNILAVHPSRREALERVLPRPAGSIAADPGRGPSAQTRRP